MRIRNEFAFLCLYTGVNMCIGANHVDIQQNDAAFCGIFTPGITFSDDSNPDDIKRFLQLLKKCLNNPVGKKTVKLLSDIIKTEGGNHQKRLKLKVIVADTADFKVGQVDSPNEIRFCQKTMKTSVISDANTAETSEEETPPEILLFHEFLHYARHIIKTLKDRKTYSCESSAEEDMTLFNVPDFPELNAWKLYLNDCFFLMTAKDEYDSLYTDAELLQTIRELPRNSQKKQGLLLKDLQDFNEDSIISNPTESSSQLVLSEIKSKKEIIQFIKDLSIKRKQFYEVNQNLLNEIIQTTKKVDKEEKSDSLSSGIVSDYRKLKLFCIRYSDSDQLTNPWRNKSNNRVRLEQGNILQLSALTQHFYETAAAAKFSVKVIDMEEIRNIIGDGNKAKYDIDKICENGFRLAWNMPLRYGHSGDCCKLTPGIVEWTRARARECCDFCGVVND